MKKGAALKKKILSLFLCIVFAASFAYAEESPQKQEKKEPQKQATEIKKADRVTFNFVDVDISTVVKFISEITGKNFIYDDKVKGKVTIIAPSKLNINDAFNLFTSVLELKGFAVIPSGTYAYKIMPLSAAKQEGTVIIKEGKTPISDTYIIRLIPLKHISSQDAVSFLQPLISKDGHISAFGPNNLLLVVDSALNIDKVMSILESIDRPKVEPEIVFLKYANADAVAKTLKEALGKGRISPFQRAIPGIPGAGAGATTVSEEADIVADNRLNAVVLLGNKEEKESMKRLIALLDVPTPETTGKINVYFLENADATELSKVLEGIVKGTAGRAGVPGQPGTPVSPFEAGGNILITPDKATNSLVIVASPSDYQSLAQVIKQLDKRRRQVFVEAMIAEVSLAKIQEIGAKWRAMGTSGGMPAIIGGVGTIDSNAIQSIISGLSGLTLGGLAHYLTIPVTTTDSSGNVTTTNLSVPGFAALFSLSQFKDAINVLSNPQILTSDNKEAEIVVGENVPFISMRQAQGAVPGGVFNTIERKDVGITLKLTPQITEGDYVKLDVYEEISSLLSGQSPDVLTQVGPTTTKRSAKTSIVVKNNQTIVIGGLMQDKDETTVSKVPILGDIPLLGAVFKYKHTEKTKTNLLIFLTPKIVKDASEIGRITEDKKKEFGKAGNRYIEDELIIRFKPGTPKEKVDEIIKAKEATVIAVIDKDTYQIRLKKGQKVEKAVKEFSLPEVELAEPNYVVVK